MTTPDNSELMRKLDRLIDSITRMQRSGSSGSNSSSDLGNLVPMTLNGLKDAAAKAIPTFSQLKQELVENIGVWRDLSKVGANFSNDVVGMSVAAREARVSLLEFSDIIKSNITSFGSLGLNVARGAEAFAKIAKDFQDNDAAKQMTQMGWTTAEANDLLALHIGFMRSKFSLDRENQQDEFAAVQKLSEEMGKLSATTGQTREHQMALLKEAKDEAALQARFRKIEREQGAEAAKRARESYRENLLAMDAQGLGDAFKDYFIRGTLISEQARLQYATAGAEAGNALVQLADATRRGASAAEQDSLRRRAEAGAIRNNQSAAMENLVILSGTGLSPVADVAGQGYMKSLPKTESVEREMASQEKLTGAVQSLEATLKKINDDALQGLRGKRQDPKTGEYKDVSQVTRAIIDTENTFKSLNAAVGTSIEKLRGNLDQLGTAVSNSLNTINNAQGGGDIRKIIEEKLQEGLDSGGKEGGVIGALAQGVDKLAGEITGLAGSASHALKTYAKDNAIKVITDDNNPLKVNIDQTDPINANITGIEPGAAKRRASGGPVGENGPELVLTGEEGPEYVLNDRLADQFIRSAVSKLPSPKANTEGIEQRVSGMITSSFSSLQRIAVSEPRTTSVTQVVERSTESTQPFGLDDSQKKTYQEILSLTGEQAKQRLDAIRQEIASTTIANRELLKLRDATEQRYKRESTLADLASNEEHERLNLQLNASADLTAVKEKELDAAKQAERTWLSVGKITNEQVEQRKVLEVSAADRIQQTHRQTAIEVQKNAGLSKTAIVKAIPLEEINEQATDAAKLLNDHGKVTLNYAMSQGDELNDALKRSAEEQLAINKRLLIEKNQQVAELETKAATEELSVRDKRRLSSLKGEIASLNESAKLRENEVAAYIAAADIKEKAAQGINLADEANKVKPADSDKRGLDSVVTVEQPRFLEPLVEDPRLKHQLNDQQLVDFTENTNQLIQKIGEEVKGIRSTEVPVAPDNFPAGNVFNEVKGLLTNFTEPLNSIAKVQQLPSDIINTALSPIADMFKNSQGENPNNVRYINVEDTTPSKLEKPQPTINTEQSSLLPTVTKELGTFSQSTRDLREFYRTSGLYNLSKSNIKPNQSDDREKATAAAEKERLEKANSQKIATIKADQAAKKKLPTINELVQQIAKSSGIKDVNKIKTGQKIKLLDGSDYTVKQGDTLNKIAQQTIRDIKDKVSAPENATANQPKNSTSEVGRAAEEERAKNIEKERKAAQEQAAAKKQQETKQPPEQVSQKNSATLDDVVARLEILNTMMSQLISVNQDLGKQQIRAVKSSASSNIIDRMMG